MLCQWWAPPMRESRLDHLERVVARPAHDTYIWCSIRVASSYARSRRVSRDSTWRATNANMRPRVCARALALLRPDGNPDVRGNQPGYQTLHCPSPPDSAIMYQMAHTSLHKRADALPSKCALCAAILTARFFTPKGVVCALCYHKLYVAAPRTPPSPTPTPLSPAC